MDVLISLDTRRKKKNGSFPILLRISGNERTLPISTGISVSKEYWNEQKREIKTGYKGYSSISRINNLLAFKRNQARAVITSLEESGETSSLNIREIKARILSEFKKPEAESIIKKLRSDKIIASSNKERELLDHLQEIVQSGSLSNISDKELSKYFISKVKNGSVFEYLKNHIAELKELGKIGNAETYRGLLYVLKKFWSSEELYFNELDVTFLLELEKWHLKKGLKVNGLATYMRTLRATYNSASKIGIADKEANPFKDYKIKTEPTAKRAISKEYLIKIMQLEFKNDSPLFLARNYFLASFAMQGMSFIDMAFLKKKNIFDGRVKYQRAKTSRQYNIKTNPALESILNFYTKDKDLDEYIFPIIKRKELENQYKDVKWARKRYNKDLKEIAKLCEIPENLTSYVSRHSFAMSARLRDTPIEAISQMLGHSSLKTTQIYLDSIPDKTIDDYAKKVLDFTDHMKI